MKCTVHHITDTEDIQGHHTWGLRNQDRNRLVEQCLFCTGNWKECITFFLPFLGFIMVYNADHTITNKVQKQFPTFSKWIKTFLSSKQNHVCILGRKGKKKKI